MEAVASFGACGDRFQLTYTPPTNGSVRVQPAPTTTTFHCSQAAAAYSELQAAATRCLLLGLPAPLDLGPAIAAGSGGGMRPGRSTVAAAAKAALSFGTEAAVVEEEPAGEEEGDEEGEEEAFELVEGPRCGAAQWGCGTCRTAAVAAQ